MRLKLFQSTKTYGHEEGLSACFRQHRATHSHCSKLHGYALSFRFVFQTPILDEKNWVVDFGGLKELKAKLRENFDHILAVAGDDPQIEELARLGEVLGLANVVVFDDGVGCEKFAEFAFKLAQEVLINNNAGYAKVLSVECSEHGANSAIYSEA